MAELTETSPETPETTEAIRAVEAFLNALQNEDFDTVDAALGDDLVYENVGFSRSAVAAARQRCFAACRAASASR